MNIGISVSALFTINRSFKNFDGIGTYTKYLCQSLSQQNLNIKEIYFKNLKDTFNNTGSIEDFTIAKNRLLSFCLASSYDFKSLNLDILHITDYLIPRVKNIPIVSTVHDAIMLQNNPEFSQHNVYSHFLKKRILKQMNSRVAGVITVSKSVVEDLVNVWNIPEEKISVVYHGLSPEWHTKIDDLIKKSILQRYGICKPFFLTVGTLQPRKNLERIIKSYYLLPKHIRDHFSLVVVGKQHPGMTPVNLINLLKSLSHNPKEIIWLEYVPFVDLRSLYQSCYALLYPSLAEGFGFPIIEGFASGAPVITSNFGAMAEIADNAAFLVNPYSKQAINTAMVELVEKPELRLQLIQRGFIQAKKFTWENCAKKTLEVYKKFL